MKSVSRSWPVWISWAMAFEVDGLRPQLIGGTPLSIGLASAGPSAASTFR